MISLLSRRFVENPHVGRQLARFSPFALGFVLFFAAGVLLLADFVVFRNVFLEDSSWLPEGMAGSVLHLVNALLLFGLLALLIPMRLSGAIDGARADRSFDQIVVTGWSPLSLHLGNWGLGLGYAGVILAVSLPFQAFAYTLGGVTLREILAAYLVLAVYANVIIAVTLALSMGERERVVVPTSIFLFILAGLLCLFTPAGGVLGEATPVRCLIRRNDAGPFLLPHLFASGAAGGPVMIFHRAVPPDGYLVLLWGLLVLPACTVLLLGPSHRFTPGLNNFGAVTLPGDRWRRLFRRQSLALARRVELAFFYENRPRWLDGSDFIARKIPIFAWVFLLWGVIHGHVFGGAPAIDPRLRLFRDPAFLLSIAGTAGVAFLALIALGDTRHRAGVRERIGPWEIPRGLLLSACAALVLAGFLGLNAWTLRSALDSEKAAASAPAAAAAQEVDAAEAAAEAAERAALLDAYVRDWGRLVAAVTLFLLDCHLIGKLLSLVAGNLHAFGLSLAAIACALLFGPYLVWLGIDEGWLPPALFPLIFLTPSVLAAMNDPEIAATAAELGFVPGDEFRWLVVLHLALAAAVVGLLAALRRRRKRISRQVPRSSPAPGAAALLLLGAVLVLAAPAAAAEPLPIEARVTRGFEGRLLGERVDFFTVVLENSSTRTIRGTLRIQAGDPPEDVWPPRPFEAPASTAAVVRWSQGVAPFAGFPGERLVLEAPEGSIAVDLPDAFAVAVSAQDGGPREQVYLVASEAARLPGLVRSDHKWVACRPFSLPEDPRAYDGASAVFIGPADLSAWTRGQRDALLDYVRLGGSVVLYGAIDRASLQGAPEWAALIGGERGSRTIRAGMELALEEIDEGQVAWELEAENGEPAVPLLTVRTIGPGRLGHLAFDLAAGPGVLGARAGGAEGFWSAFESRVPRSAYPACVMVPSSWGGSLLLDAGPLFSVVSYFVIYMVFIGPGLAIGFRRKSRRRWVLPYIAGVSLLFVAGIPILDLVLHSRPSYAAITRVACFGPGARRGVVQASVSVRSSGRQRHRLGIDAERPSAYFFGTGVDNRFREIDVISNEPGRLAGPLELALPPWGSRSVLVLGDASRAEPITGRVVLDARSGRGSLRARGVPPPADGLGLRGRLLLFETPGLQIGVLPQPERSGAHGIDLAGAVFSGGEVAMDFPIARAGLASGAPARAVHSLGFQHGAPGSFIAGSGCGPRAVLAFFAGDVPISVASPDLAFEREVAPRPERRGGSRRPPAYRLVERGGKSLRSFEGVLILQELELEIR